MLLLQRASNVPYSEISKWVDKPESQLKVYHKRVLKKLKQIFFQLLSNSKSRENKDE